MKGLAVGKSDKGSILFTGPLFLNLNREWWILIKYPSDGVYLCM